MKYIFFYINTDEYEATNEVSKSYIILSFKYKNALLRSIFFLVNQCKFELIEL